MSDMASGQPELRSLSFILWRRLWIVTLDHQRFLRRFINIAEAIPLPLGCAYFVNSGSDGSYLSRTLLGAVLSRLRSEWSALMLLS